MQLKHIEGVQRRDWFIIDPRLLKIDDGYNVRDLTSPDTREHIDGLKVSIGANGVRVPLEIRTSGDDIYIVAGHCRHVAVMELIAEGRDDIKGVPCIQEPSSTNDAERVLNLVISNSGKPLTTLEVAEVVRRLEAFGWTEAEIQKRMRWKSRASVTDHAEIAALPESIKGHIRNGDIAAGLAKNIAKGSDPDTAKKLIEDNLAENKRIKGKPMKVTPKTLKRDHPKPKPAEPKAVDTTPSPPIAASPPPERLPPAAQLQVQPINPEPQSEITDERILDTIGQLTVPNMDRQRLPPTIKSLLDVIEPFATRAQDFEFSEMSDGRWVEVEWRHLKKAWVLFAKVTGGAENV